MELSKLLLYLLSINTGQHTPDWINANILPDSLHQYYVEASIPEKNIFPIVFPENLSAIALAEAAEATAEPEIVIEHGLNFLSMTSDDTFSTELSDLASYIEHNPLWYSSSPSSLKDCSGVFHRLLNIIKTKYPDCMGPEITEARDSRSIARWYQANNSFHVINNAMEQRHLIRPGAVLFFGAPGRYYRSSTLSQMNSLDGVIRHIGVVTEVFRDEEGNVTGYVMMHGRRPGVYAQRTYKHKATPPRPGYPVLGNWNQQLVGLAYMKDYEVENGGVLAVDGK
ncbi:MAG TPA: hypothetical protein PKA00_01130 [Saprospiraceae bacterium]|nr:hypothetical protein [Saprospiraceae bacterium]HMQ81470.1 hypothetical protein [Saprospiraceae bacterium]